MAILKKALYIRLLLAAILIISVLFIDMTSSMMILLLIFSSLLSLLDEFFGVVLEVKKVNFFSSHIIVLLVTFVSFLLNHEFEAAIFSLLFVISNNIVFKTSSMLENEEVSSVSGVEEQKDINDVLSYNQATEFKTEKILKASTDFPLFCFIIVSFLTIIFLALIWHYNFRVSAYRGIIILYLSLAEPLYKSMNLIGTYGLCECLKFGYLFNCAENAELNNKAGLLKCKSEIELQTEKYLFNSSIDVDTFKNIILHVIYQSDREELKEIKDILKYSVDISLIEDFNDYGSGIVCTINKMPVYFGKKGFIHSLGLSIPDDSIKEDSQYLYLSDRYIGCVEHAETKVSDESEDLSVISSRMGDISKKNVFLGYSIKSLLVCLTILGMMKLWIALLIETGFEIIELFNVKRMMK